MTSLLRKVRVVGLAFAATSALAAEPVPTPSPAAAVPPQKPGPHVKYENPEVDLGEVVRGANAEAMFVLRNVGSEPLRVISARPG